MSYTVYSFFSVILFASVHIFAKYTRKVDRVFHGRFLSVCGGVAIAYVFIDILPKLSKSDLIVKNAFSGIFPYFEYHVYVLALSGFLLFFAINHVHPSNKDRMRFSLSIGSYALFNFLVGYAVADPQNPEVKPLFLFTLAMGLHYFTNDYTLYKAHGRDYERFGKWILLICLFGGWIIGSLFILPEAPVALVSAFIGGGVILNVTRHELPKENPHSLFAFLFSSALYSLILLLF